MRESGVFWHIIIVQALKPWPVTELSSPPPPLCFVPDDSQRSNLAEKCFILEQRAKMEHWVFFSFECVFIYLLQQAIQTFIICTHFIRGHTLNWLQSDMTIESSASCGVCPWWSTGTKSYYSPRQGREIKFQLLFYGSVIIVAAICSDLIKHAFCCYI